MKKICLFLLVPFLSLAQNEMDTDQKFAKTVEQSLNLFYQEYAKGANYDSIIAALNYEANEVPSFSDEVYCKRIQALKESSPMPFECTESALSVVKFFAKNRRNFVRVVMGRSSLYFDLFEETLSKYGLPIELKYLSVIERGLRPQVRSRAGAMGLWQFMYRTGLMYGLTENSYIDERMDPVKSTDAACRYLKQLYDIYGDWFLALAAYNAGPGNVNKAIRRSGGKKTYWEVRPYLPRETQGYVPNFIAATYLITYHKEHNIIPFPSDLHLAQLDTMCLKEGVQMAELSRLVDWDLDEIKALNPVYKTAYIPKTDPPQCIQGPLSKIGALVSKEAELYSDKKSETVTNNQGEDEEEFVDSDGDEFFYHTVKRGESLAIIANKYDISIDELKEWNMLTSNMLYTGMKLKIMGEEPEEPTPPPATTKKYYTVRRGDTFSVIARRHGLTQTQLKRLNPGINVSRLDIGQKIRIR
ncbi:MAG: LysM peptidoglycan-binding domain-containing protein [Crocinitomicaceae bacterium]|jgi:membrane-bound lytic murein transglycosylase D|nr:LysM peptidoglycan-binding domain-containing protein [Crocinitomicaceae bacterium]